MDRSNDTEVYSDSLVGIAPGKKVYYNDGSGVLKPVTVVSIINPNSNNPKLVIEYSDQTTTKTVPAEKVQA